MKKFYRAVLIPAHSTFGEEGEEERLLREGLLAARFFHRHTRLIFLRRRIVQSLVIVIAQRYQLLGSDQLVLPERTLFVAQCLNRIEAGRADGGNHAADQSHQRQDCGSNQHADG